MHAAIEQMAVDSEATQDRALRIAWWSAFAGYGSLVVAQIALVVTIVLRG